MVDVNVKEILLECEAFCKDTFFFHLVSTQMVMFNALSSYNGQIGLKKF